MSLRYRLRKGPPGKRSGERGMTLIEITLASTVLAITLVTMAKGFGISFGTVQRAREMTRAARFLEETMDSLEAQSYQNLPVLNGNVFFDGATAAASRYRIDLAVTPASVDLLQIRSLVSDRRTGQVLTRLITYRSKR